MAPSWWVSATATGSSPHAGLPLLHPRSTGRCDGKGHMSPNGPPVKRQENTALLSNCGLTGTPQHVSLLGLGGEGRTGGVHSADVDGVELPSPLLAEAQSIDCGICAACFSAAQRDCTHHPEYLPPVQQRPMDWVQDGGTKTHSMYHMLLSVPYITLFLNPVASKQAQGLRPFPYGT